MIDYKSKNWIKGKITKKIPLSQLIQKSIFSLLITLTVINVFLIAFYMINNSDNPQKGYILKKSRDENSSLQFHQKLLQTKLIELQKLDNLRNNTLIQKMEPATEDAFQFITPEKKQ